MYQNTNFSGISITEILITCFQRDESATVNESNAGQKMVKLSAYENKWWVGSFVNNYMEMLKDISPWTCFSLHIPQDNQNYKCMSFWSFFSTVYEFYVRSLEILFPCIVVGFLLLTVVLKIYLHLHWVYR